MQTSRLDDAVPNPCAELRTGTGNTGKVEAHAGVPYTYTHIHNIHIHIYIYIYTHTCIYIYIYIHTQRARERERERMHIFHKFPSVCDIVHWFSPDISGHTVLNRSLPTHMTSFREQKWETCFRRLSRRVACRHSMPWYGSGPRAWLLNES